MLGRSRTGSGGATTGLLPPGSPRSVSELLAELRALRRRDGSRGGDSDLDSASDGEAANAQSSSSSSSSSTSAFTRSRFRLPSPSAAVAAEMEAARLRLEARARVAHSELRSLAVVLAVWSAAGYIMAWAGVIAHARQPRGEDIGVANNLLKLPDMGFDLMRWVPLPELGDPSTMWGANNLVLTIILALTTIRMINHPRRVLIFRRMLVVHSVICLVRSAFILMTSLPDPYDQCHGGTSTLPTFLQAMYRAATFGFSACGDVFFSGHMAVCVMAAMVWKQYTTDARWKFFIWCLVVLEGMYLLRLQWHYTIDIVIGAYIAIRVWESFHSRFSPVFTWLEAGPAVLGRPDRTVDHVAEWLAKCPPVADLTRTLDTLKESIDTGGTPNAEGTTDKIDDLDDDEDQDEDEEGARQQQQRRRRRRRGRPATPVEDSPDGSGEYTVAADADRPRPRRAHSSEMQEH